MRIFECAHYLSVYGCIFLELLWQIFCSRGVRPCYRGKSNTFFPLQWQIRRPFTIKFHAQDSAIQP